MLGNAGAGLIRTGPVYDGPAMVPRKAGFLLPAVKASDHCITQTMAIMVSRKDAWITSGANRETMSRN